MLLNGSYEYLLTRWRFSIELFVKLFLDDVSNEPGSILYESSGFSTREQRFRQDMERLKNMHQKDLRFEGVSQSDKVHSDHHLSFQMERDRIALIQKTFRTLNAYFHRNQSINPTSSIPPLAVQRIRVTFKDEPGEGSGVARSFYASIIEVSSRRLFNSLYGYFFRRFYPKRNFRFSNWVLRVRRLPINLPRLKYNDHHVLRVIVELL